MNPVVKTILGSIARHWLGAFIAFIAGRQWLGAADSAQIVPLLTNDMVADLLVPLGAGIVPVTLSIYGRLKLRLKVHLAFLQHCHKRTSEKGIERMIRNAPVSAQIAAVFTGDPTKIVPAGN